MQIHCTKRFYYLIIIVFTTVVVAKVVFTLLSSINSGLILEFLVSISPSFYNINNCWLFFQIPTLYTAMFFSDKCISNAFQDDLKMYLTYIIVTRVGGVEVYYS